MDYDFTQDVGLIRIRPGRKLAAAGWCRRTGSPAAPPMKMLTVGCSEGNDATAWYTKILNPRMQGLRGTRPTRPSSAEGPKQGRSGGGLSPRMATSRGSATSPSRRGDHGLYATPRSIYSMLDRNNLMALYAPVSRGLDTLVADGRSPSESSQLPARPRRSLTPIARSQSPDSDEPQTRRAVASQGEVVTLPHPSFLGISDPVAPGGESRSPGGRGHHEARRLASDPDRSGTPRWSDPGPRADRSQDRPRPGSRADRLGGQFVHGEIALAHGQAGAGRSGLGYRRADKRQTSGVP